MNRPTILDNDGKRFWDRHAPRLKQHGMLTESTFDAFVLLCKTYSLLIQLNPIEQKNGMICYIALSKLYQTYARGFRMNTDKVNNKDINPDEKDEFGL